MKTVIVPVVAKVCTLNDRLHWRAVARHKHDWRTATATAALALGPPSARHCTGLHYCRISYPVRALGTRRDPHNWVLTSKWIIDGLVDAGVLTDDDSTHLITLDATFHKATEQPNVVVRIADTLEGLT